MVYVQRSNFNIDDVSSGEDIEDRDYRCVLMAEARCLTANGMLHAQWPRRTGAEGRETGKERR